MYITVYLFCRIKVMFFVQGKKNERKKIKVYYKIKKIRSVIR